MAARKRESEGRNSDLVRLGARFDAGSCTRPKFSFGQVPFPFINSSQNRWYLERNTQNRKIWKSGILGILKSYFWKVSFSFINSSQNRWYLARNTQNRKIPKFARACSCLLVLSLCLLMLAREWPCSSRAQIWKESFPFINYSQNRWYLARNVQNLKIPKFARACSCSACACSCSVCARSCSDLKIQFLEGVISLYKFTTKSVISGSKCPKSNNWNI